MPIRSNVLFVHESLTRKPLKSQMKTNMVVRARKGVFRLNTDILSEELCNDLYGRANAPIQMWS
jgi:hypothetical protein